MTTEYEDGSGMSLAVADPDLRIAQTDQNPFGWSQPKDLTVTLRGRWQIKESAKYTARDTKVPVLKFTGDGNTLFTLSCQDGMTDEYLLENIDKPLSGDLAQNITFTLNENTATVNGESVTLLAPVAERDGVKMIAAADFAKILDAPIDWNEEEQRVNIDFNDKKLTFTVDSRIATNDNSIIILEHAMVMENDRNYLPVSALQDILKTNVLSEGSSVSYIRNDAAWKDWNEKPNPPLLPYLDSISVAGEALDYNKNVREYTIEVPEEIQQLPEVTYTVGEDYAVTVTPAQKVPGRTVLALSDKNDRLNTSLYTVKFVYPNSDYRISASVTPQAENAAENVMDGDSSTYWACDTNGGYITFELEKEVLYSGVGLSFMSGDKRKAFFKIEISEDGEKWTEVYDGETSGTTLGIEKYEFTPTKGRFIRIIGFGNSVSEWFSLSEAEIYKTNL